MNKRSSTLNRAAGVAGPPLGTDRNVAQGSSAHSTWFLKECEWGDACWTLAPTSKLEEQRSIRLRWDFTLTSGGRFTDAQHAALLESARRLIALMRTRSITTRLPLRAQTVAGAFLELRMLLRWMSEEGLSRFSELDEDAINRFTRFLADRPNPYQPRANGQLAPSTIRSYLTLFVYLYHYRDDIGDGLLMPPFAGNTPGRHIGARESDQRSWPHTPDAIAMPLVQGAIDLLETSAMAILRLREVYRIAQAIARPRVSRADAAGQAALRALQGHAPIIRGQPYRIDSLDDFSELVELLYTACYVVISYLVGARVSEILHLESGCLRSLPVDSMEVDRGVAVVVGAIFKHESGYHGRPHQWVVPAPAVHAISVLEALSSPHRARLQRRQLWLRTLDRARGATEWDTTAQCPASLLTAAHMRMRLQRFANWLNLPLYEDKPWRLSTHQGRKTFARFAALRDRSALFALAQHLGHRDRAVSDMHYAGKDYDLEREIDAEVLGHSVRAWEQMLEAEGLGGRAGAEIIAKRPRFRGERAKQDLQAYARMLADAGLRLGVCEWGFCVYRQEYSACLGNASGPDPVRREPSTCARCRNFAVSAAHRSYWDEQVRRHEALLNEPALPTQTLKIARERLAEALAMLRAIDRK